MWLLHASVVCMTLSAGVRAIKKLLTHTHIEACVLYHSSCRIHLLWNAGRMVKTVKRLVVVTLRWNRWQLVISQVHIALSLRSTSQMHGSCKCQYFSIANFQCSDAISWAIMKSTRTVKFCVSSQECALYEKWDWLNKN